MPTNANTFNSRVTSEALEAKFRQVFPSQSGAELPQDLFASGVITPIVDFSSVAEGSGLPSSLQSAWDFSTSSFSSSTTGTTTLISNPGFWKIDVNAAVFALLPATSLINIEINDGTSTKTVWRFDNMPSGSAVTAASALDETFNVFLRSGDSLQVTLGGTNNQYVNIWYRQIADVYGNLSNPLGFSFT